MKEIVLITKNIGEISMLEKEKTRLENFAKENGLSLKMMTQKVQEIYDEISEKDLKKPEDERLDDKSKMIRAYRRARYAFKREARSLQNSVEGMIVCRYPDNAFVRTRYRFCMSQAEKNREEAIAKGYINEDGDPIYDGKKLDLSKMRPFGRALAYTMVEKNGKKIPKPVFVIIGPKNSEKNIPVCQLGKLSLGEATSQEKNFRYATGNDVWYNAGAINDDYKAPYTASELTMILTQWSQALDTEEYVVPKIKTFEELEEFKKEFKSTERGDEHSFDFCFAPMTVQGISQKENDLYSNVTVTLEMREDSQYLETINVFVVPEHLQGLCIEPGVAGVAVLQAFDNSKKGDKTQWHLGGFLPVTEDVEISKFFE